MLDEMIRQLRQARGLKQEELGRRVGASKQSVSNWENGNIMPSVDILMRLADYFSVSTDYLLGRERQRSLDTTGLSEQQLTYLQQLIDDLRGK